MAAFFDHELIFSLGCESAINFPIRRDGRTLGSLNLLDVQGKYSAASLDDLITPAAMASPILNRQSSVSSP